MQIGLNHEIVLHNDVNTFDHVIDTLVRVCNHDDFTEQCAILVHYKGNVRLKQVLWKN